MCSSSKIDAIRNERERHFAAVFFDHDEWESQPETIHFKGGCYRPDFLDKRRGIYIEVVGTRQAFANNRYKYLYMLEVCKDLKLEFRSHKGEILNPYKLSLATRSFMKASEKVASTGVMPEGKSIPIGIRALLVPIVIETNYTVAALARCIGIPPDYVRRIIFAEDGDFFIKTEYVQKIREFHREYQAHPENYPPRDGTVSSIKWALSPELWNQPFIPAAPATTPSSEEVGGDAA